MRRELLFAALLYFFAAPTFAHDDPLAGTYSTTPEYRTFGAASSPQDAEAIRNLMRRFGEARSTANAQVTAAVFADDVEWTNAYGEVFRGVDNPQKYFRWDLDTEEEEIRDEESIQFRPVSLRFLGDDAAVLHGMTMSTFDKGEGTRRVQMTFVVAKQSDRWRIVHVIMAAAREQPLATAKR